MIRFEELGHAIAEVQDADRKALRTAEEASESYIRRLRHRNRRSPKLVWLAAAAAVALAVGAGMLWLKQAPSNGLELAALPGVAAGKPIIAPVDHGIPLNFSDGSRIELASGSEANIVALTNDGATVEVLSGKATASVVHRPTTHWLLQAGPYRVAVTGTRFALEWQPNQLRFELTLNQGSVVVTTENSSHAAITMRAPEHLVIDQGQWHLSSQLAELEPNEAPSASTSPTPVAPAAKEGAQLAPARPASSQQSSASTDLGSSVPEWQRLARLGKYAEAYAAAQRIGVANLADSAAAQAMLPLAETCRFTGHASESISVLTKLRQRYSGSDAAAIAAFQLGRLSSDGNLAATWFRNYLRERPNGDLAREASGRLLEALDRAGDGAAAARAAHHYLQRYPSGPHAKFARQLTERYDPRGTD